MTWEPAVRTRGRGLRSDLQRLSRMRDGDGLAYRDAHYFAVTLEVDPVAMRPWLPFGLRLAEPARADLFTAYFPDTSIGSVYREAGLFVHVRTRRGVGIHCPWMIVDDDVALTLGREVLGYPKKTGEFEWDFTDERISATASRRGSTLITMSGALGATVTDAPPFLGRPHRNVTALGGLALPRIIAFTPGEHPIEVREIDEFSLSVRGSERDPLDQMGLGDVVSARLHRVNLSAGSPPVPLRPLSPLYTATRMRPRVF